jgi:hypothetical protein
VEQGRVEEEGDWELRLESELEEALCIAGGEEQGTSCGKAVETALEDGRAESTTHVVEISVEDLEAESTTHG